MQQRLTAISLFSWAGGMDVGVRQAGFDVLACLELDKHCCSTLRENISRSGARTTVYEGNIRTFSPEQILNELGVQPGGVDLLFGGPPCETFIAALCKKPTANRLTI